MRHENVPLNEVVQATEFYALLPKMLSETAGNKK